MQSNIRSYVTKHRARAWTVFVSIRFVVGIVSRAPSNCIETGNFLTGIATISFLTRNEICVIAGFQSVQEICWDFLQRTLVVTDVSGQPVCPICPLKIGPTGCTEKFVNNKQTNNLLCTTYQKCEHLKDSDKWNQSTEMYNRQKYAGQCDLRNPFYFSVIIRPI